MITTHKYKTLTWVDLESPVVEDIKILMQQYNIPPIVADELLKPTIRPKADIYGNIVYLIVYLILHFPIYDISRKVSEPCEVDFILGKNFIITAHYKSIIPLHELVKIFEVSILLKENHFAKSVGRLTFLITKKLYDYALRQLEHIHSKISEIEERMFTNQEKEMVKEISYVQRDTLEFQRAIHAHGSVLKSLYETDTKITGKDFTHYLNGMLAELARVENLLDNSKETVELLRDTNDSLLSSKTNEVMKTLTVMAFVTFPAMFLATLFSMNTRWLPIVGVPGDFWIVLFLMLAGAFTAFSFFKRKKWI